MADLNENGVTDDLAEVFDAGTTPQGEAGAAEAKQPSEIETRARAQGWVDKDEFKGPAEKWRPADEFVKRGEDEMPILRERTKYLADKVAKQEQEFATRTANLERMAVQALHRQRDALNAHYEQQIQQAVEVADVNRYHQLNQARQQDLYNFDVQAQQAFQPQQGQQGNIAPPTHPSVVEWRQQNAWFDQDPQLHNIAAMFSQRNAAKNPGISLEDNLKATAEHIRTTYLGGAPAPRAQGSASVEGGNRVAAGGRPGKTAADLPPEARQFARSMVKDGVYKTEDAYAKDYFSQ